MAAVEFRLAEATNGCSWYFMRLFLLLSACSSARASGDTSLLASTGAPPRPVPWPTRCQAGLDLLATKELYPPSTRRDSTTAAADAGTENEIRSWNSPFSRVATCCLIDLRATSGDTCLLESLLRCWSTASCITDLGALGRARATRLKASLPFTLSLRLSHTRSCPGKWEPGAGLTRRCSSAAARSSPHTPFRVRAVSSQPFLVVDLDSQRRTSQEPARVPRPQEIKPHQREFQISLVCRSVRRLGTLLEDLLAPAAKRAVVGAPLGA